MAYKMERYTRYMFHKGKSNIWRLLFILVWCMQMFTAVYFCCQKQGFHEDEYYTYYSTARTYGLNIEDNAWMEHEQYFDEFVVREGERFQYGLVKQVQSWDVHPPVYYWLFHTISSFFPGKFSKWYGLALNLAAFGVSMFLLHFLCLQLTQDNEKLSLLVCLFYGFTPAVMSSVVFIRMYALLTVFVLLCTILHVRALRDYDRAGGNDGGDGYNGGDSKLCIKPIKLSVGKFLIPLGLVTYFGFLTQYYYFIFLFFMAAAFCVYLLYKDRTLWNCIRYALSLAIAFVLAYLTYPACLGQMFRGQRGAQATGNFFDLSNTFMRLDFFYRLLDEYVFGNALTVMLILIIMMLLYIGVKKNINTLNKVDGNSITHPTERLGIKDNLYFMLIFTTVGYFFTVSKTALLLGETSIRYQTPVYGIVVLLVFTAIDSVGRECYRYSDILHKVGKKHTEHINANRMNANYYNMMLAVAAVILMLINISGLVSGKVVFLYPEDEQRVAFAKEVSSRMTPVVCIYDENQSWCVWDAADEFFEYNRIYFVSQGSSEPISDADIRECSELVVYLSNTADVQEQLERIMSSNPELSEYELQYSEKYCDVYYLYEGSYSSDHFAFDD